MRLLIDANLSPRLVSMLGDAGYDARHVFDLGLHTASDATILEWAAAGGDVVVTADSDFSALLATRQATAPSVIHLRQVSEMPPPAQAELLVESLPIVADLLDRGAVVSLSPSRLAVRELPIR